MPANEIIVVDYGVGNLLSVRRGLEHCGAAVTLTSDPAEILSARRVVLPGVGAFGDAMAALHQRKLVEVLQELPCRGISLLGICLGMQLLFNESEEFGLHQGLGLIPGRVQAIPAFTSEGLPLKVPHIGWNELHPTRESAWEQTCLSAVQPGDAMYFVHSFVATPDQREHGLATCDYGGHQLMAVVRDGPVIGCQFHPEKSGEAGLRILREFCES